MKRPLFRWPNLLTATLAAVVCSSLAAQDSVATDPVGYMSHTVNDEADLLVGVPMLREAAFSATVDSVSGDTVNFSGSTVPDVTTEAHFLLVTDGSIEGEWYEIASADDSSVTLSDKVDDVDGNGNGLGEDDSVRLIPFWTLDTLFPEGGGVPQTSDIRKADAVVMLNKMASESKGINPAVAGFFLYHDGAQVEEGWHDRDNPGETVGDEIISPESFITVRNRSGSSFEITLAGSVPVSKMANYVFSSDDVRRDNLLMNPFPVDVEVGEMNFVSSGAIVPSSSIRNPEGDRLFVYPANTTSLNPPVIKFLFYHDGSVVEEGWHDVNEPGALQDDFIIEAGAALVIRKTPSSSDSIVSWAVPVPYDL